MESLARSSDSPDRSEPDRTSEAFWRDLRPGDPFPRPRRVGSCDIVEEIGRGGFGIVYRAIQDAPRRVVALKLLCPSLAGEHAMRRLRQEAEILARLDHPNIARVFEAGEADFGGGPQPYFVMELIEGDTLRAHARDLDLRARVALIAKVARALQHAHQKGVVHRDVNPANILVRAADGEPKVIDFGVAALLEGDTARAWHTREGQMVGTLPYMSPEQVRGAVRDVDTLSDVHSLGVVAFELLTGRLPYAEADLRRGAIGAILYSRPLKARAIDPRFPRDLELVLDVALRKDRERRYPTAEAFALDLERFLAQRPISARPSSAPYLVRTWAARNPGQAAAGAAAVLCALGGVVGLAYGLLTVRRQADLKEARIQELAAQWDLFDNALRVSDVGVEVKRWNLELYLDSTRRSLAEDPKSRPLRVLVARFLVALASLEIDEGDARRGARLLDETRAVLDAMLAEAPLGRDAQRIASLVDVRRGDLAQSEGDYARAWSYYESALARDRALTQAYPRDARVWDDLCWSLERKAWWLRQQRRYAEAEEAVIERHELALDLLKWDDERLKAMHNASTSYLAMAGVAEDRRDAPEALRLANEGLRLALELQRTGVKDASFGGCYGTAVGRVGRALFALDSKEEAVAYLRDSVDLMTAAYTLKPTDHHHLELVYASLTTYANALRTAEQRERGADDLRGWLVQCGELERLGAQEEDLLRLRSWLRARLARLDPEGAGEHARLAREGLKRLFDAPELEVDVREWIWFLHNVDRDPQATYAALLEARRKPAYDVEALWTTEVEVLAALSRFDEARAVVAARDHGTPLRADRRAEAHELIRRAEEAHRELQGATVIEASAPAAVGDAP